MLFDIGSRFFPRIDLLPKFLGLCLSAPVQVFANKRHVPVVRLSAGVKYSDPLTGESEVPGVER
jgi:hypothetical protein